MGKTYTGMLIQQNAIQCTARKNKWIVAICVNMNQSEKRGQEKQVRDIHTVLFHLHEV